MYYCCYVMYSYCNEMFSYCYVLLCIMYCYVFVLLCLFLLLCMYLSVYSVPLCCSAYCLCVNVYCTVLYCCHLVSTQTNISYHPPCCRTGHSQPAPFKSTSSFRCTFLKETDGRTDGSAMFSQRTVPRSASPSLNLTRRVCLQITAGWPGSGSSVVISWHGDACHIFIRRVPAPPCYHGHHSLSVDMRAHRSLLQQAGSYCLSVYRWLCARSVGRSV